MKTLDPSSNASIGDMKCLCLSESLALLPHLETLILCGNRLTDRRSVSVVARLSATLQQHFIYYSIEPILEGLQSVSSLTVLDLSSNKLDHKAIGMLRKIIGDPSMNLKVLNVGENSST
jgi:Ran GTPase-activating protein (RanGAP) involved in mRNA processing and transport